MADSLYVAMGAAAARASELESIADNLANVDTPGFRANQTVFESFLPPMRVGDRNDQVHVSAVHAGVDQRAGPAVPSDSPLDVRLGDGAWLSVELPDGAAGFTRDGRITVGDDGVLRVGLHPVLTPALQRIRVDPAAAVAVSEGGEVSVDGKVVADLGRFALDGALIRVEPSVVKAGTASAVDARVETHMREGSNVNAMTAVVRLVQAQRAYDEAMQSVTTARRLDERSAELGRVR
jgi:flagellar basal-body rod protein FlgF